MRRSEKPFFDVSPAAAVLFPLLYFLDSEGWFAALLPTVLLHELGHWAAVRLRGGRVLAMRLDTAGLCMETTPFSSRADEVLAAACGPAAGLLWTVPAAWIGGAWGSRSALTAAVINAFNLLPAAPLDGGRILLALTGSRRALLLCSGLTAGTLAALSAAMTNGRLLLPALLILWAMVRP